MIRRLLAWLDAHRCRQAAIREVFALRALLDAEREKVTQLRNANRMMEPTVRRLTAERDAAREDAARERSMLNDQWAALQRVVDDRDFWKAEALKAGEQIVALNVRLGAVYVVADGLARHNGELRMERDAVPLPARLRVVEGGQR